MIVMAIFTLIGVVLLVVTYVALVTRRGSLVAAVKTEVSDEAAAKQKRAEAINRELVDKLATGTPVERAINEYQSARGELHCGPRAPEPWNWESTDIDRWRSTELRSRLAQVNRQLWLPAVGTLATIVLLTAAAVAVYYNQIYSRNITTASDTPTPALPGSTLSDAVLPELAPSTALPEPAPADPSPAATASPPTQIPPDGSTNGPIEPAIESPMGATRHGAPLDFGVSHS